MVRKRSLMVKHEWHLNFQKLHRLERIYTRIEKEKGRVK